MSTVYILPFNCALLSGKHRESIDVANLKFQQCNRGQSLHQSIATLSHLVRGWFRADRSDAYATHECSLFQSARQPEVFFALENQIPLPLTQEKSKYALVNANA